MKKVRGLHVSSAREVHTFPGSRGSRVGGSGAGLSAAGTGAWQGRRKRSGLTTHSALPAPTPSAARPGRTRTLGDPGPAQVCKCRILRQPSVALVPGTVPSAQWSWDPLPHSSPCTPHPPKHCTSPLTGSAGGPESGGFLSELSARPLLVAADDRPLETLAGLGAQGPAAERAEAARKWTAGGCEACQGALSIRHRAAATQPLLME